MKRDMDRPNLRAAFQPMPETCHDALMKAARSVKEEQSVKKRIPAALVLSAVLGLALIGTAYAVFSSRTAEFFGLHWNRELGKSLQEGKIARIGESVTIGDVVVTLDEIVCQNRSLYGVGTAKPVNGNDVILSMDLAEDPECFALSEEAQALAAKAGASGGRLLTVTSMPLKIGVDEGTMLTPGCTGYYDVSNGDGSVTFSFESTDGFVISEGTSYQILMECRVSQIDENGRRMDGTGRETEWTVSCVPAVMNTPAGKTPLPDADAVVIGEDEYELLVPDSYRETGTMPVYRAAEVDFTAAADPGWFNSSGIKDSPEPGLIRFHDHAVLSLSPEALSYSEFADDSYAEAPSGAIVELTWMRTWIGRAGAFTLQRTALSGVTLQEAMEQAEELIGRLGIGCNRYVCEEALDMSLERIRAMGAAWDQAIADGELLTDDAAAPFDWSSVPAGEEGYYLRYSPLLVDTSASGGRYGLEVYVNSRGIVWASVRNQFNRGEIADTPETLVTPRDAIARLTEELARSLSWYSKKIRSILQVRLTYEAVRADSKPDGMAFAPVWMILYQDESAAQRDDTCYALVNAVDGTLIDASYALVNAVDGTLIDASFR